MQDGKESGFTLLEIIAVLVLLGILTAVAVPRFLDLETDGRAAASALKARLRYAQARSMASDTAWGVGFSGTSYVLFSDARNQAGSQKIFPGEEKETILLPKGLGVPNDKFIAFDDLGRPVAGSEARVSVGSVTITITPVTGYIP